MLYLSAIRAAFRSRAAITYGYLPYSNDALDDEATFPNHGSRVIQEKR